MSNSYFTNPIVLDTFTAAIDVSSSMGNATGTPTFVKSIEWQTPTNTAHTCTITDAVGGNTIFSEKCTTENQSIIKYYNTWLKNLCIALAAGAHMGSGKIIVVM